MGNIFINLETLGDLRQIFLPSLILNVFFLLLNSPKILFLNSFHIFYYKFCEIFFIRNSAYKLVNGSHYEVGRIAPQQPFVMTSGIQKNAQVVCRRLRLNW